ncbi:MAG: peptidase S10 [Acidobacteriota bacterium]
MILSTIFSAFLLFQVPTVSPSPTVTPRTVQTVQIEETVVQKHSINIGGKLLNYTTTTGFIPIRNSVTGDVEARMFYMAYTLDNPPAKRPLMFSFNGGPGSASVWLHLGALGPKRVKMQDEGWLPAPPYELVPNEGSWFPETDLVFIDPVGTGYSRATRPELASKFFGLQGDTESVGEFIRLYLGRENRWSSPLYLVGESYGTTRASALSNHLFDRGIALNGICLVSVIMNFQTSRFAEGNDLAYQLIFPSYTATAWYHKQLPADLQRKPLSEVLKESENFVENELAIAYTKGDRMSESDKQTLLDKYSRLTGLSKSFVLNNDYRVDLGRFNKELLRDQQRTTGRLDSRFTGIDRDADGNNPENDPSMSAIRPPYTATFNDYVRRELGFKSDVEYYILGGGITSPWNWGQNNGYANTAVPLQSAMQKNPFMKIFVASGYYDMATPYYATEYTFANMNLDPTLRKNISTSYYESGHMMYIEKKSLVKLKNDFAKFMQGSLHK